MNQESGRVNGAHHVNGTSKRTLREMGGEAQTVEVVKAPPGPRHNTVRVRIGLWIEDVGRRIIGDRPSGRQGPASDEHAMPSAMASKADALDALLLRMEQIADRALTVGGAAQVSSGPGPTPEPKIDLPIKPDPVGGARGPRDSTREEESEGFVPLASKARLPTVLGDPTSTDPSVIRPLELVLTPESRGFVKLTKTSPEGVLIHGGTRFIHRPSGNFFTVPKSAGGLYQDGDPIPIEALNIPAGGTTLLFEHAPAGASTTAVVMDVPSVKPLHPESKIILFREAVQGQTVHGVEVGDVAPLRHIVGAGMGVRDIENEIEALQTGAHPCFVLIHPDEIPSVRQMSRDGRCAWAVSQRRLRQMMAKMQPHSADLDAARQMMREMATLVIEEEKRRLTELAAGAAAKPGSNGETCTSTSSAHADQSAPTPTSMPSKHRFIPAPLKFLLDTGLWYEINRLVLHPRGLMLAIDDRAVQGGRDIFGIVDGRSDPEGICYMPDALKAAAKKIAAYDAQGATRIFEERRRRYGYVVQPLAPKATITHPELAITAAEVMDALPQDIRTAYESRLQTDVKQEQLRMIGIEAIGYVMIRTRAVLDSERLAEHELLLLRQIILELATVFVAERLAWEDGNNADFVFAWLPSLRKSIDWRLALFRPQS